MQVAMPSSLVSLEDRNAVGASKKTVTPSVDPRTAAPHTLPFVAIGHRARDRARLLRHPTSRPASSPPAFMRGRPTLASAGLLLLYVHRFNSQNGAF